jgi:hypothetical protein
MTDLISRGLSKLDDLRQVEANPEDVMAYMSEGGLEII